MINRVVRAFYGTLWVLGFAGFLGCKGDTPPSVHQSSVATQAQKEVRKDIVLEEMGCLSQQKLQTVAQACIQIDYTFRDLPLTMNQDEPSAVRTSLFHMSPDQVDTIDASCLPISKLAYMGKDSVLMEAEIYYDGTAECAYWVLLENQRPKCAYTLSEPGKTFYSNLMKQLNAKVEQRQNK